MPVPQIPYSAKSTVSYPPDDGKTAVDRAAQFAGNFTRSACHKLSLSGSDTHVVGFGTVAAPGAKAILVEYNNDDAQGNLQPIEVSVNGGAETWEVSPGGHIMYSNPNPTAGITAMSIAHTSDARVNVWILG